MGHVKIDFEYRIKHVGFSAEFYGDESREVEFDKHHIAKYEEAKDTARIFYQNRDNVPFSASELLAWYLGKTGTVLEDYIPGQEAEAAITEGKKSFPVTFTVNFAPASFYMPTKQGHLDLKRLDLIVEFLITPKWQS